MKNMVTIKDIARESGYSVSTVSRVLNHRNDVSPDAKKKIEKVVAAYNFVPNNNAKHLKQSNSKSIGVLVKGIQNMLFASIVEEIQCMIENTDYTLIVSYLDEDADEVEQAVLLCRERKPLGLLFLGGNPEYFKKEFAQVDVPCVLVTNLADQMDFPNLSSVATDDIAAAKCAVDALFDAGHTKIGINEMGTGTVESFMKAYGEAVQHLQQLQPDAVIYLQAIMKVTTERSGQGDYITNEGIEARNEEIAKLADDEKIYYLDVNPLICDETGGMVASYTYDGVHLKAQYIPIWLDFLKEHAVE